MNIRFFSFVLFLVSFPYWVRGQSNTINSDTYLYNMVSKNILTFNIRNANESLNGVSPADILDSKNAFFEFLLPDNGFRFNMRIDSTNFNYPKTGFEVYKIYVNGFNYVNDTIKTKNNFLFMTTNYLVAVETCKKNRPQIKFISGQFYPTKISEDFNLNLNIPSSCLEYLKYRMYLYLVNDIEFLRRQNDGLIFSGYSEVKELKIEILLKKDDLERPVIVKEY